jgi:hypothetical protein
VPSTSITVVWSTTGEEERQLGDPRKQQVGRKPAAHFVVLGPLHPGKSQQPTFPPDRGYRATGLQGYSQFNITNRFIAAQKVTISTEHDGG